MCRGISAHVQGHVQVHVTTCTGVRRGRWGGSARAPWGACALRRPSSRAAEAAARTAFRDMPVKQHAWQQAVI